MKKRKILILMVGVLLSAGGLALATPITIQVDGVVTDGYGSLWGDNIHTGTPFSGTYTYDSATPNTSFLNEVGKYVFDSPYGMNFSLGGFEFKTTSSHTGQFTITIADNGAHLDEYEVRSNQNVPLSNGATVDYLFWLLGGSNSTISSTALPLDAPVVSQWQQPGNFLSIFGYDLQGHTYHIYGMATQAVLVPEPLTGVLMAAGVLLIRRKK